MCRPGIARATSSSPATAWSTATRARPTGGGGGYGGLGVVDAATGAYLGGVTDGPFHEPRVANGPAGQVYAADAGVSPTDLYLYDVTGTRPVLQARRPQVCGNLRDLSARPDGSAVVAACGSPYSHDVYSAAGLTPAGSYPTGAYPSAAVWSADGSTFVAGTASDSGADVRAYLEGATTPARSVDFGLHQDPVAPRGLAVSDSGSRVWAVTGALTSGYVKVRVLDVPDRGAQVTVGFEPNHVYVGQATTVRGRLSTSEGALAGEQITVRRSHYRSGTLLTLPPVTTGTDGTYAFKDTPPTDGHYAYSLTWSDRALRGSAQGINEVVVSPHDTQLSLSAKQVSSTSNGVAGTAVLSYTGTDSREGRPVLVRRTAGGTTTEVGTYLTNPNGVVTFTDSPPLGSVTYTASVEAFGVYPARTATTTASVQLATSMTATSPVTALIGEPVTVTGRLTAGGSGLAGARVTVTRSGCTTTAWSRTATTAADGSWSTQDLAPPLGGCSYRAEFFTTTTHLRSAALSGTTVVKRDATVGVTLARGTGSAKKFVYVTGSLAAWHNSRTLTITAHPVGGAEVTLATGPVSDTGTLTVRYQPKTTTTYRVKYAGDDWYKPAIAERTE